jgi:cobalt-zinc-cadmium efflux system protein
VQAVHDTRLWSLDGESHVLSAHVVVGAERSADEIFAVKQSIKRMLRAHSIEHATIEIERPDEDCPCTSAPTH